jgi:hypothetical protein
VFDKFLVLKTVLLIDGIEAGPIHGALETIYSPHNNLSKFK